MFVGAFLADETSLNGTAVPSNETTYFSISNAVYDDVYFENDVNYDYTTEIPNWDYDTEFHAKFNGNIFGGNVEFTLASVSEVLVKRREYGSYDSNWVTLYGKKISDLSDLSFYYNDPTVASRMTYEYAAVPIVNGSESSYQTTSVYVEFEGAFIVDSTHSYQMIANMTRNNLARNNPVNVIEPINSKYPFVNYYSNLQYDRFTLTGLFAELDKESCIFDTSNSWKLRKQVRDFLTNRKSKIVKFYNGEIYLVAVVDNITESQDGHPDNVNMSINFVEIGDVTSNSDLYYHGFSNFLEAGV